jgi:catechol 2,3-dioxygenase-like lactoylglutathione lyase family enzyme
MIKAVSHIALFVPDLHKAETFYKELFDMELIGREIEKENGLWYTLPFDKDWEAAEANGIELGMTALRNGGLVLALFKGEQKLGQVFAIGLNGTMDDIQAIHAKLTSDIQIDVYQSDRLEFVDPYYITWQIAVDPVFDTAGHFANRWLVL